MAELLYIILGGILGAIGIHVLYAKFIFNKVKGENRTLKEGLAVLIDNNVLPVIDEKITPKLNKVGLDLVDNAKDKILPEIKEELKNVVSDTLPGLVNPMSERIDELEDKLDDILALMERKR